MIERIAESAGEEKQYPFQNKIQRNAGQHGAVQECGEVVMKVENTSHGPEGRVMEKPSDKEPTSGVLQFSSLSRDRRIVLAASLLPHGNVEIHDREVQEERYVSPPYYRIAEQIYAIIVSREKLSL